MLVQREEQLTRLRAGFEAGTAERRGNVALVGGPVGAGKTALLEEFAGWVAAAGGRVLRAAASVAERDVRFGVLAQLFQSARLAPEPAARVDGLLRDPAFAVPLPEPGAEPAAAQRPTEHRRAEVVQGLVAVVAALAEAGRLLLVVDDVQHADPASLHCLLYLVRRLRYLPVTVLVAETTMLRPPYPLLRAELLSQPHFTRVALPPLDAAGLTRLAAAREPDPAAARREAERCLAVTGGSPALARALLEDPADDPADGFEQAVLGCLYRHEPAVRQVATALAVLDRPTPADQLAELLGLPPDLAARATGLLAGAGLVDGERLRHPRIVRAVLTGLPAEERRRLHRRAAEVLHDHGADLGLVADHLLAAGRTGDPWGVPVLTGAAAEALRAGRPDVAVAALRLVDRAGLPAADRAAVTALEVDARWQLTPLAATGQLAELRAAGEPGAALAAVPYLLWLGRSEDAAEAVDRAAAADPAPDGTRLAAARLLVAVSHPGQRLDAPAPPPAEALLPAVGVLAEALRTGGGDDVTATAEHLLRRRAPGDRAAGPLAAALAALLCAGRADRVLAWTDGLLDRPGSGPAPTWRAVLRALRAEAALRLGDLGEAAHQAGTALRELPPPAWGVLVAAPLAVLVDCATEAGDADAAERWLTEPVPPGAFRTPVGLLHLAASARHHLAAGRPHLAADILRSCGRLARDWDTDVAGLVPWRLELARALLRLGDRAEAARLLEEQLATADDRTRGRALRLLAGTVPLDRRRALLSEAVDLLRSCGDRLELARALGDTTEVLQRVGHPARARLLERARQLPPEPADEPDDGLSDAERRVAALAAQGRTNREISAELYITVSTVEQHLTRVYRKLDVKRRSELPGRLVDLGGDLPKAPRVGVS